MALALSKAAQLKPEIRLAQALSQFQANLSDERKAEFRTFHHPPKTTDVARLTAEIDRDAACQRKSRRCVGPRLMNVLQSVQEYSTVVDLAVETAQSQIAGAIWAVIKLALKVVHGSDFHHERSSFVGNLLSVLIDSLKFRLLF